jgi:16S rRNA (guanine527-N7)-methyltransferase
VSQQALAYVGLLAKWNRTINLTRLQLEPASDEALDRLLVEAFAAERVIDGTAKVLVDVGSGGGSPAIPIKLVRAWLELVLVESRSRKCAFLREAVRELGLQGVRVANCRFEALASAELPGSADVVTVRAVRVDFGFWKSLQAVLRIGGQAMFFGSQLTGLTMPPAFQPEPKPAAPPGLTILRRVS